MSPFAAGAGIVLALVVGFAGALAFTVWLLRRM
jgi:nitrate reductase NapE component